MRAFLSADQDALRVSGISERSEDESGFLFGAADRELDLAVALEKIHRADLRADPFRAVGHDLRAADELIRRVPDGVIVYGS